MTMELRRTVRRGTARLVVGMLAALGVTTLTTTAATRPASAAAATAAAATTRFVPLSPVRLVDTRDGTGTSRAAVGPGAPLVVEVAGKAGVPTGATAVVVTLTITRAREAGWVQLGPTGQVVAGSSSTINVQQAGADVSNTAFSALGTGGSLSIFTSTTADVVIDLAGYFVPAATARDGRFVPIPPARVVDTRSVARLNAGSVRNVPIRGVADVPSSGVAAVVANVIVDRPDAKGFVQVAPRPVVVATTSNLNPAQGRTVAGLVVTPLGTDGSIDIYTSVGADLVVDIVGYVTDTSAADSSGGLFVPVVPQRQLDTRTDGRGPVAPGTTLTTTISALPSDADAAAVVGNLTAVDATEGAWIQIGPSPLVVGASSSLNSSYAGHTVANAVVAAMTGRSLDIHASGRTHLLLDVVGYFTATPTAPPTPEPAAPVTPTPVTPTAAQTALATLATLATDDSTPPVPYDRADYGGSDWLDADRDCHDTRAEVLIMESRVAVTYRASGSGQCLNDTTVDTGQWFDPYTARTFTLAADLQIDHVVALSEAHRSGAWAWDPVRKSAYANDLDHAETLIAVDGPTNNSKGDRDPSRWLPPNVAYRCTYVETWVTIKATWSLAVDTAERTALTGLLVSC